MMDTCILCDNVREIYSKLREVIIENRYTDLNFEKINQGIVEQIWDSMSENEDVDVKTIVKIRIMKEIISQLHFWVLEDVL